MKKYYYLLIPALLVPLGIFGGCAPAGPGAFGHCRPPIVNNIWNYAVCPQNSALAIVVTAQPPAWETTGGSGEGHLVRQPGCGVYKTVDYGVTWEEITNNAIDGDGNPIPFLSAYIVDEQTYWLGSNGYGMFKTTNGGETWQVCDNFPCDVSYVSVWHIDGNQDNPDEIYFCSFDMNHFEYNGGTDVKTPDAKAAFRSLDGGASWEQINNGFQDAWAGVDILGIRIGVYLQYYGFWIAVSQADPNVLYYAHPGIYVHVTGVPVIGSIDINSPARMYKSTDKGGNWTKSREFTVPPNKNCVIDLSDLMSGLKIEDLNAASFYVAPGIDDGNLACSSLVNAVSFFGNLFGAVVEAPQSEYREEWGMAKSTEQGALGSWTMKNTGLPIGDDVGNVYTISPAIAPSSPDTVYVGVQDKGVYQSVDGGESWSEDTEHNAYIDTESDRGTGASLAIAEDGRLWMSLTYINKNDQGTLTDVEDDVPYGESYNPLLTTDDENPSAVVDLSADRTKRIGTAELSWSAAGDEGEKGRATNYIVKYSSAKITEENFDECAAAYPFIAYECEQLQHDGYQLMEDDGDALNGCSLLCNAGPEGEALVLYGPSVAHQFNPGKDYAANFRMRRWEGDSLKRLGFLYVTADGGETNYSGAQYSQANFPDTFYHELPVVFPVSSSDQQWEFRNTYAHRGEEVRYDRVTIVPSPPKGEKITCRVNNLSPGEWHFAVKAMDKVGKLSAISNPVSCDIATIVPENLSALSGFGPLSIDLSWDECAEAAGYFVYRSTYNGEYAPISPSYPEDFETMQLSRGGADGPEDEGDAIKTKQSFSPGTSYWLVVDADCQYSDSFDGSVGVWFWVDNQNYLDFYYKIEGGSQTWAYKFGKGEPVTAEQNVMKDFAPSVKKHLRLVHTGEKIKLYLNGSKVWADIHVGNAWQDKEIKVCFQADGGDAPEFKQFFGNRKVRKLVLNTAFHDVCPEFQEYYYKVSAVGLSGIGDVEEMWDNPSAESSLSELAWCLAAALDEIAPAAVTDLQAFTPSEGAENGSLRLTWTATGDDGTVGTATRYILKYSAEGPPDFDQAEEYTQSWQPLDSGKKEEKMLGGFRPATTYWFALKVVDEADNRSKRDTIFPRPFAVAFQDTTPPAVITDLTGWDAASLPGEPEDRNGKWILSWTAPGDDGLSGTVSAYIVHYATYDVSPDTWSWERTPEISGEFMPPQLVGAGENQQLVLTGLEMLVDTTSQTTYYFLVRAADESYFMPEDWGLEVNYSPPAKTWGSPKLFPPSRAPDFGNTVCLSPKEIKWCWEDKSLWESGYRVYDDTNNPPLATLLANTESWTESGTLAPNESYSRVIEPFNAAGASTTTLPLFCYSLANPPEGLTILTSLPPTSKTVSLSWSPASEGGNNGYHVEWYDRDKKDWLNVSGLLPETSTTYTITGLAENTRNWFRVWGYNAELARTAEPTDKIAVWTTAVPPVWTEHNPLSAAAREGYARQIKLEWYEAGDPPKAGCEDISKRVKVAQYFVKMATFAFTDWDTPGLSDLGGEEPLPSPYKPGLKKQYDVKNLDGDTKYWFAVRAMDEARVYSVRSNVASAKPLKGVPLPKISTILTKTMNRRPIIKGTAEPNSTIKIYDNGEQIGMVTADAEGNWTFIPETLLKVGPHAITAKAHRGGPTGLPSSFSAACEFVVEAPPKTCLYLAGPIPFNPNEGDLVFNFDLHEDCQVKLFIYNIAGERVRKLIDNEDFTAACYGRAEGGKTPDELLHWDGTNDDGEDIASGVYFYYFKAGDKKPEIKKLLLIRK